ncbi:Ribonuclease HII [uncultured archaeon]|nr:Ribonuclease HII [uncultured archaeon]
MNSVHAKLNGILVGGADEAGRGPVIGPLVLCVAIYEKDREHELRQIGVRDSKLLSPAKREELAPILRDMCHLHVQKITAKEINALMKKDVSLNEIEAMWIADAMKGIEPDIVKRLDKIYVDAPDPDANRFTARIKSHLPPKAPIAMKLHSSHKADVIYPVAGAASIIAKVTRDQEIERIKEELGCDFGTGYSHDAATIKCVEENIDNPILKKYLRTEWATTKNIIARMKYTTKQVKLDL